MQSNRAHGGNPGAVTGQGTAGWLMRPMGWRQRGTEILLAHLMTGAQEPILHTTSSTQRTLTGAKRASAEGVGLPHHRPQAPGRLSL